MARASENVKKWSDLALHADRPWNFRRGITARSDCKIRVLDSDMYAYFTRGHLGLPPERKSWLFTPIYREKSAKEATSGVVFCLLMLFPTHYRHRARILYHIFRQSRQTSTHGLNPHMHYKSHVAVANRSHFAGSCDSATQGDHLS